METILSTYKAKGSNELLFFTGSAYSEALFSDDIPEYNYEGFALTSNPATGFDAAYRASFNSVPMLAEPQFYDSLLLVTLAAEYCIQHKMPFSNDNINNALKILTTGASQEVTAWDASGMAQIFSALDSGSILTGASGALKFASDTLTTVVNSVYLHWCIYNKKIIELDYTSTTPSKRISENVPIRTFIEKLSSTPDVSYRELYNEMLKRTLGSHVQVINASKFGSLYDNFPSALFD
ncbi:MAG: hypothetical protein IJP90_18705 [Treponema sp.]|nr:hypothetical protein [Treponema sp.]